MLKKSHLMVHCYQILCFSMSNYLNVYTFLIILTVTLLNVFFFSSDFLYIHFTGYQMKA